MSKRIYRLGPDVVSTEMLTLAKNFVRGDLEEYLPLAQAFLEVAKKYYRQGAFNMEHRSDGVCQAEDQGGHPCCSCPAEFYVPAEVTHNGIRIFCKTHREPTAMVAAYGAAPWTEDFRDETWDVTITKFGSKLEVVKALRLLFDIDLKEAFDFCTVTYGDMLFGRVINGGFTSEIAGNIVRTLESVGCVADLTLHIPSRHTNKWRLK